MLILNFTHPLTPDQRAELESLAARTIDGVIDVPAQFDLDADFGPQAVALVDACGLSSEQWQTTPIVIMPPALSFITAAVLAELHGRMGYFAPCVRLRPASGALPPQYEVAELIDLQAQRDTARRRR